MKVPQKGGRLLFLVLVSIFSFNTSHVCACLGETYSITERVQNAPIVFEGVVIQMGLVDISTEKIDYGSIEASSLSTIGDPNLKTEARIIVKRYIKGDGPPVVTVRGFGGLGGGDCQSRVKIGDHALFFAIETSVSGTLTPAYLGVYSATESIQTGVLAEALSATNQEPTLYLPFVHGKLISVLVIALYSLPIYGLAGAGLWIINQRIYRQDVVLLLVVIAWPIITAISHYSIASIWIWLIIIVAWLYKRPTRLDGVIIFFIAVFFIGNITSEFYPFVVQMYWYLYIALCILVAFIFTFKNINLKSIRKNHDKLN